MTLCWNFYDRPSERLYRQAAGGLPAHLFSIPIGRLKTVFQTALRSVHHSSAKVRPTLKIIWPLNRLSGRWRSHAHAWRGAVYGVAVIPFFIYFTVSTKAANKRRQPCPKNQGRLKTPMRSDGLLPVYQCKAILSRWINSSSIT